MPDRKFYVLFGTTLSIIRRSLRRIGDRLATAEASSKALIGHSVFSYRSEVSSKRERDAIKVGSHCYISGQLLVFRHDGRIRIGEWVYIGPGSTIWSASNAGVTIGNRVAISMNVHIHDTDSHPIDATKRFEQNKEILTTGHPTEIDQIPSSPIIIEDDVWIGLNAVVLKGVTLGKGSIVSAMSVVTRSVPPFTVVAGNPARVIKTIQ